MPRHAKQRVGHQVRVGGSLELVGEIPGGHALEQSTPRGRQPWVTTPTTAAALFEQILATGRPVIVPVEDRPPSPPTCSRSGVIHRPTLDEPEYPDLAATIR